MRPQIKIDSIFRDEKGITTTAMAVAIMLSMALIISGAQVYKTTSACAEIQEVADICALAAESEVAEFMVCVKACDATVLTMGLFAGATLGLGVVCACVPPLEAVSTSLVKIGNKAIKARSSFSKKAANGLNKLQVALPFLAAAAATSAASANNRGAMETNYLGCAFLLPQKGKAIQVGSINDLEECASDIAGELDDLQERAKKAEEAAKEANKAKNTAYELDCGNSPGYCQYERAGRFSWMPSSENPYYSNVDAWSFSVAFERAKAYYAYREGCEEEPSGSVEEKASYFLRMKFYSYAYEKLETEGFVNEGNMSFNANFPKLYRNTGEFRQTSLYTSAAFPVTSEEGQEKLIMHAWDGCPAVESIDSYDCIAALDAGVYVGCETCNFSVESLGNVASASTNIANGFEYHYDRIRQEAEKYQKAISEAVPLSTEVKEMVSPILATLGDLIKDIGGDRISAEPCGSSGAIAVVVNKNSNFTDEGFETLFVKNAKNLGTRIAVSGAALVEDDSDNCGDIISGLLDGFGGNDDAALGGAKVALRCWSGLLKTYEEGQQTFSKAISKTISTISLGSLTGLGEWAADAFENVISSAGLEPANLNALKPAVLNTGHLTEDGNDAFAVNYKKIRSSALSVHSGDGGIFSGISNWASEKIDEVTGSEITIAEIEFPVSDSKIPITIAIPDSISSVTKGGIISGLKAVEQAISSPYREKVWR